MAVAAMNWELKIQDGRDRIGSFLSYTFCTSHVIFLSLGLVFYEMLRYGQRGAWAQVFVFSVALFFPIMLPLKLECGLLRSVLSVLTGTEGGLNRIT